MASKAPIFSQIVQNQIVGRGPVIGVDGKQVVGSHRGVDLAVKEGTEVHPVTEGVVVFAQLRPQDYGNLVVVKHELPNGVTVFSLYAHMKESPEVREGDSVTTDTVLGLSGHTGRVFGATGDHVHFEIVEPSVGQTFDKPGTLSNYFSYPLLDPKANPYGLLNWNSARLERDELTRAERQAQLRLTDVEFESYKSQLASIETKGKGLQESYLVSSKSGEYLGRDQLGKGTGMVEAGYLDRAGNWTDYAKAQGIASENDFLKSPAAQDDALRRLTYRNAEFVVRNDLDLYIGDSIGGAPLTGAGLLFGAHNSRGNLKDFIESQGTFDQGDGNNFGISNYVSLGRKLQTEPAASSISASGGHWEDHTEYDLLTGLAVGGENKVWIPESSSASVRSPVATSSSSPGTSVVSASSNRDVIRHEDGAVTINFIAKADSSNGEIKNGDLVTQVFEPDGRLNYYSVTHTERGETTVLERVPGAVAGEAIATLSQWIGNTLQFQGQWDLAGNRVGDRYTVDGVTYTLSMVPGENSLWLDPNGLSATERVQQSYDQENQRLLNLHVGSDDVAFNLRTLSPDELFAIGAGLEQASFFSAMPSLQYADASGYTGDGLVLSDAGGGRSQISGSPQNVRAGSDTKTEGNTNTLQAAAALGLINTIIGLQHWDQQSDLSHASTVVAIYNQLNGLNGGQLGATTGLGNLGQLGVGLGLLSSLESGNVGGIVVNGIGLGNAVFDGAFSNAIGSAVGIEAANVVPGLGLLMALDSGNPWSMLSAALAFIPVWGQIASVVVSILGSLLADETDLPMKEGQAQADWDATGHIHVSTTQDVEGGGASATEWMTSIVSGLEAYLAGQVDATGQPVYGLIAPRLPSLGYQYDPDGMNYTGVAGHLYLKWVDDNGQEQTRYYDGNGSRNDGTGETLASDFMKHAAQAIVPSWEAETALMHWQKTEAQLGVDAANAEARQTVDSGLPQEQLDQLHQVLKVLVLSAATPNTALVDIDGDGYLERTDWVTANQAMLALDKDGDGLIGAGELLNLNAGNARNALSWLDANGDLLLDQRDPAFAALRVWIDANGDGQSDRNELQYAAKAGIVALDFSVNPPQVVRADGSRISLTEQALTGDLLGTAFMAVEGGVLEAKELGETVLHALNLREFDGDASHTHGGDVADSRELDRADQAVEIGMANERLVSTTQNTLASVAMNTPVQSTLLDAASLTRAAPGVVLSGQVAGTSATQQPTEESPVSLVTFVPAGMETAPQSRREVTAAMVRSAASEAASLSNPLMAMALGMAATQWPTVASAGPEIPLTAAVGGSSGTEVQDVNYLFREIESPSGSTEPSGQVTTLTIPGLLTVSSALMSNANGGALAASATERPETLPALDFKSPQSTNPGDAQVDGAGTSQPTPVSSLPQDSPAPVAAGPGGDVISYPTTSGERFDAVEDTTVRISAAFLLANDTTANGGMVPGRPSLSITAVGNPVHGRVALTANAAGDAEIVFLPEANYHGEASFTYTVTDQYGLSSLATGVLQVAPVNDAPVARGESASGDEDNTLLFASATLLANDFDVDTLVDGDPLRITRVGVAEHGTVFLDADGTVRFIPDANYNGPAQFTYWVGDRDVALIAAGEGFETPATVRLAVMPVNDLPVAVDESIDSSEDTVLLIAQALLLANDNDVDTATTNAEAAQVLSITEVANALHGTVSLLPDGRIEFTPDLNYFGVASFTYTVDDGHGGRAVGTAMINLAPVNDAPDVNGETFTFNEDEPLTIAHATLLDNDGDVDNPHTDLRIVAVDNATHGAVVLNADGTVRYTPDADYFGAASFTYTVSDGVGGFTVGTAILNIAPVNDAPRLTGEAANAVDEDSEVRIAPISLLANDSDVDNAHEELQISSVGNATHGAVQILDGEIVFTPTLNYFGQASFTYTVTDGVGGTSQATVSLTFNPVNDAPVVNNELLMGKRDVTYTLAQAVLLANDTDAETPSALTIVSVQNSLHGIAVLNANGSITFVPEAGYAGRGSFEYVVQDPDGSQTMGQTEIDFSRANLNPVAVDDSFTGFEDVAFIMGADQLMANDSDPDGGGLTSLRVDAVRNATNGTVALQADGSVRFDPRADFNGTASFEYRLNDGEGGQTWAKAILNVQSVNDAPIIEDIWYGRPLYGYRRIYHQASGGDGDPGYTEDIPVYDKTQAMALASSQSLFSRTLRNTLGDSEGYVAYVYDYAAVVPSYYRNGDIRPLGSEPLDATFYSQNNPFKLQNPGETTRWAIDDLYRQGGSIVAYDPDGDSSAISFSVVSGPQHGHAWANQYTNLQTDIGADHTAALATAVAETGAWQYYSHRGDPYSGLDVFSIRVTDGGGASTDVTLQTSHLGSSASGGGGGACPVVLDLDSDGIELISANDSNIFMDVNHDGWRERVGWAAPDDGVLTFDINRDGRVDIDTEVSFVGYKPGARTDLEGLAAFDTDGDGKLSSSDTAWAQFGVFRDANGNGKQDAGEWLTLDQMGIAAIGLQREGAMHLDHGNVVFGTTAVEFSNGTTALAADVMFAGQGIALPQQVRDLLGVTPLVSAAASQQEAAQGLSGNDDLESLAQEARLTQMALVFNQYCTSAGADAEALGFVNWAQAGDDGVWTAASFATADQPPALALTDSQLSRSALSMESISA